MRAYVNITLMIEDGNIADFTIMENNTLTEVVIDKVNEPIDKEKTINIINEKLTRLM